LIKILLTLHFASFFLEEEETEKKTTDKEEDKGEKKKDKTKDNEEIYKKLEQPSLEKEEKIEGEDQFHGYEESERKGINRLIEQEAAVEEVKKEETPEAVTEETLE